MGNDPNLGQNQSAPPGQPITQYPNQSGYVPNNYGQQPGQPAYGQQPYAQTGYQQQPGQANYQQPVYAQQVGASQSQGSSQQNYPNQKSRIIAGILGILLGGFGLHSFYLGYNGRGVAQLLVTIFTLGFGSIWGFVEGILYLVSKENSSWSFDAKGIPLSD